MILVAKPFLCSGHRRDSTNTGVVSKPGSAEHKEK